MQNLILDILLPEVRKLMPLKKVIQNMRKFYERKKHFRSENPFTFQLNSFVEKNKNRQNNGLILCWEFGGFPSILAKNAILSKALKIRGYETHFIICDGIPEACIQRGLEQNEKLEAWNKRCISCINNMSEMCKKYSLDHSWASQYIDQNNLLNIKSISLSVPINEIVNYEYLGIRVGDLALTSLNRYMKGLLIDIKTLKQVDEIIYRKYFFAAMVNTQIAENVIQKLNPKSIYTSHGVYVDYAPPALLAVKKGIISLVWDSGFADFLHYFTVPLNSKEYFVRSLTPDEWNKRKQKKLTSEEDIKLKDYFYDRYYRAKARDLIISLKPEEKDSLKRKIGINNDSPIICLFSHINWDAVFGSGVMIFDSANEWVIESIKKMMTIKNVNWIIKVHPGEIMDGSLQTTGDIIKKEFPVLPDHIKVLYHNSDINTWGLFQMIDAGITIYGTVGVEMPILGKPVIVAGNANFGNKGFTIDAKNKNEYFSILENAASIKPLTPEQIELAKQYAYSYFIQRQVPINIINKEQGHWGDIDLNRLNELLPGKDIALDRICEGIINGKDVYLD